jgi:hypothetical protein
MKNYFEKNEEKKFESIVGGKHQKINSTFHSHRERGFKNPKISGSRRTEVKNWRNQRFQEVEELKLKIEEVEELKKSKIEEVKRLKKSKVEEVEDLKFGDSTRVCNSN